MCIQSNGDLWFSRCAKLFLYAVMFVTQDAISEKIREKRNELQQAKASVNADMVNMRHLENKVMFTDCGFNR